MGDRMSPVLKMRNKILSMELDSNSKNLLQIRLKQ